MDEYVDKTTLFGEIPGPAAASTSTHQSSSRSSSNSIINSHHHHQAPTEQPLEPTSRIVPVPHRSADDSDVSEHESDSDEMASVEEEEEEEEQLQQDSNASLRKRIIQVASASEGFFKHQQLGDPDLTKQEKHKIAAQLLNNRPAVFLQRFGRFLSEDHLLYFEDITDQNYEIEFYLKEARQRQCKYVQDHKIRNRRFNALQKMIREGDEHFNEESMRMRNPLLYDQLIRKYQTQEERSEQERPDMTNCSLSNIIIDHMDLNRERELKKRLQAVDDEEFDTESEDESDSKEPSVDSQVTGISGDEKNALRKEFVNAAYQTFLAGKDHGVDYARIDNNSELDDLNMEDQENQDRYFDEEELEIDE